MHHSTFNRLIDLAECSTQARCDIRFCFITRSLAVSTASSEATLHQSAERRFVGLILKAVALGDFDALLR